MVVSVKSYTIFALNSVTYEQTSKHRSVKIIHGLPHVHGVFIIHIAILHLGRESATLRECAVGRDAASRSPHTFELVPTRS